MIYRKFVAARGDLIRSVFFAEREFDVRVVFCWLGRWIDKLVVGYDLVFANPLWCFLVRKENL